MPPMVEPSQPRTPQANGADDRQITAALDIVVAGQKMHVDIRIDAAPAGAGALIPIARGLNEAISGRMVEIVEANGKTVSCRKGCGACCRQAVPVSIAEARAIHALVERMPEPRRGAIRARFAAARERLQAAGLLDGF